MPNGKSSSRIMVGPVVLGMDLSKEDGLDGAILWASWVIGLVDVCGCGSGGLTTLIVGTRPLSRLAFEADKLVYQGKLLFRSPFT